MLFTARPANMKFTGITRIILSMVLIEVIQVNARPHASRHLSNEMNKDYGTHLISLARRELIPIPVPNSMEGKKNAPLAPRDLSNRLVEEYGLYVKPRVRRSPNNRRKSKNKGRKQNSQASGRG